LTNKESAQAMFQRALIILDEAKSLNARKDRLGAGESGVDRKSHNSSLSMKAVKSVLPLLLAVGMRSSFP